MPETIYFSDHSTTKLLVREQPKVSAEIGDKFNTLLFLPQDQRRYGEGGLRVKGYFKRSYEGKPLISILTVVFNGAEYLEDTIKSVISQTYENVEYLIIDGGSTDGTLEIIKKYEDKIDYWVSEKDSGIYNAMNKGAQLVTGDYVNFLNADDHIINENAIEKIVQHIKSLHSVFFCRANVVSSETSWIYPAFDVRDIRKWLQLNLPNHQTMFFPKSFYKKHMYDERFKIGADDDYKLFALKEQEVEFVDIIYVTFSRGGVSSNHKNVKLFIQRFKESFLKNYKHRRWIRFVIDPFKLILMFVINKFFGDKNFSLFIQMILKMKR